MDQAASDAERADASEEACQPLRDQAQQAREQADAHVSVGARLDSAVAAKRRADEKLQRAIANAERAQELVKSAEQQCAMADTAVRDLEQ